MTLPARDISREVPYTITAFTAAEKKAATICVVWMAVTGRDASGATVQDRARLHEVGNATFVPGGSAAYERGLLDLQTPTALEVGLEPKTGSA